MNLGQSQKTVEPSLVRPLSCIEQSCYLKSEFLCYCEMFRNITVGLEMEFDAMTNWEH